MNECWLKSEARQCCCSCRYHLADYYHCAVLKPPGLEGKCVCDIIKGWICTAPEFYMGRGGASGWPEHSIGCEMYERTVFDSEYIKNGHMRKYSHMWE